ncbi:hypothetical protein WJ97_11800 [Burkholderia ubonensis]|uniref:hypothetical protein n=1 Tax=Burkholderia ubonensis TaxID=101571 RepID=UPI00075B0953|nr:hypothetical protein [Burkholderia ubonensis]KVP96563.1 hypothetical protein WJ97_11800 [Burkholderia ubonensis]
MSRLSIAAVLAALGIAPAAHADVGHDKYLHAGVSAVIASTVTTLAAGSPNRLWYGIGSSLAVGVAKEIADSRQPHNKFDSKDLLADLVGTLAGAYLADSLLRPAVFHQPNGYVYGVQLSVPLR